MRSLLLAVFCCALAACMTTRAPPPPGAKWEQRVSYLQKTSTWQLDGRVAVALGTQGWQATLNWREQNDSWEVHLAGPFGVGALLLRRTAQGLSLNGTPPSESVLSQLQEKLGFDLPLDHLRYWVLGVPDPSAAFELTRNDQDRASKLTQDGWSVDFDRYVSVQGDLLPAHVVVSREGVRVRIVIDHWTLKS
ncbi:MAG: lipoprotein insertase outer membrane protein LolB [Pseudomonadota bacterium]|nr:lipoprotein insertase outer membrane protein LolB [Pseudomonadota bacterium]